MSGDAPTGRLTGKVALVTGAARGIGEATARRFAAEGARVLLADKRDDLGAAVTADLGVAARYVSLDVTDEGDWARAVDAGRDAFGGLDVLVNCAGIIRVVPFADTDRETFQKVIDTNLLGAFLGMKAVVPLMAERGGGSIVNFSSPQGLEGRAGMSAYTASKFAVRGLTKTTAIELGPLGIRVNTVVPGPTKTAMTARKGWTDADYDAAYGLYPLGRMASAEEIATMCLFLASDESSFCTGADFVVDGGITAGKPRDPACSTAPTAADPLARFRLDGRVAIVTGGGRGIGRTLSQGLAAVGASVVVAGRTESACAETVAAIEAAGGAALAVVTDIGRSEDRVRLVEAAVARFDRLDVVVNNAAILKPHMTVKVTEAELRELLAVNVEGPVFLSQHALPHLAATGHGSIVNLSALGAFQPMPGIGAYCAVKAAMVNWTSTMAKEWAVQGVRVNALVPGPVATDMILPRDPEKRAAFVDDIASQTLIGRVATPDDLVGATIFLASDASSYMTGRSLFVDGGMLV